MDKNRLTIETPKGKFTKSNPIDGFQIISINEFKAIKSISSNVRNTSHKLYFDLIIFITHGKGEHSIDFQLYNYEPGTVFIIKNGQYHAWKENKEIDGYLIFFNADFYPKLGSGLKNQIIKLNNKSFLHPNFLIENNFETCIDLIKIIQSQYGLKIEQNQILKNLIHSFLTILELEYLKNHPFLNSNNNNNIFNQFYTILSNGTPLPNRNAIYFIAKLNTTYKKLNRLCKSVTSMNLKSFINLIIITRAKKELTRNKKSVSQIGYELSFEEVGNFSKFFKKQTGFTPKQYQKNQL
ncbi:MAG: hypothetical protein BM563_04815 [Bacteroidetes bacterium MedPE-SWsnd-G1]|nr:MAG: hypothetical protein BM563_04815 [Bacteroidetes bacterium MedPE-SWsnd-G1]